MLDPASSHPELARALAFIAADARHGRFATWGLSTVIDENTGGPVIEVDVFDALHAAAGIDAHYPVGNAGVLHVYGYWFSEVMTPYGRKRDRWQDGELALALGQAPDAFHLSDVGATTPLQRVTAAALPYLEAPGHDVVARGDVRLGGLDARAVLVRADASSVHALIYGIRVEGAWRLITTFPFSGDADAVVAEFVAEPRLRWNAAASEGA